MIEHMRTEADDRIIYCPVTHAYENFRTMRGDEEPGTEECNGCGEWFDLHDLEVVAE